MTLMTPFTILRLFTLFLLICVIKFSSIFCPSPLKDGDVIYGWPQRPLASFEASSASRTSVTFRPQIAFSLQIHQDGHHGGVGRGRMATTSLSSRPHASAYNVPAFASGLGMTLEPIKTAAAGAGATNAATTAVTLEKVSEHEIFQDLLPSFASLLCKGPFI